MKNDTVAHVIRAQEKRRRQLGFQNHCPYLARGDEPNCANQSHYDAHDGRLWIDTGGSWVATRDRKCYFTTDLVRLAKLAMPT